MGRVSGGSGSGAARVLAAAALVALSACSWTTSPDESPQSARVRVEGTSPHPLLLVTSSEFHEQYNTTQGTVSPVLDSADSLQITLPYDATLNISRTGSVYVELRNLLVPTASVRLRVTLDNGKGYDQSATLSDDAALVYYYVFTDYSYR